MPDPRMPRADEVDLMVEMGRAMHAESSHSPLTYDSEKVRDFVNRMLDADQYVRLYESEGKVVGLMLGVVMPAWFSEDLCAYDFALYVNPEKRGGRAAVVLVRDFMRWAKGMGAKQIRPDVSTGDVGKAGSRLYRMLGFEEVGASFVFNVR